MNNLCADIGYRSINKSGEELCGDRVEVVGDGEKSTVIVLADGLGSGVKASILSTLTAKIIATMVAAGLKIEDCVETIAATLPVCSVRGVAYSTFTIIKIENNDNAEIISYDNPRVIFLRDGDECEIPTTSMTVGGKTVYRSRVELRENDVFIAVSDGCVHAGIGHALNFGWERKDICEYIKGFCRSGFTAKTLNAVLLDECYKLYGGKPGDDATACTVRIRRREPMNLLIGPPSNRDDCSKMMSLFFAKEGKHIVCGGTTSSIAAAFLGKRVRPLMEYHDPDVPPISKIDGVDLVTEGVLTVNKVLTYAGDYLSDNKLYSRWCGGHDGASMVARLLFEEATDINFYVGRAVNPAHQNPDLPLNFNIKMRLVDELSECLKKMGKRVKVSYF
ncbi:MAG: SpoIIE family protein phosphatase [Clostridiales bacterium]|jgi:hypothetical protein|nr:SpoIIE family protein phosphatase [Clostridiales bacterium]